MGLVPSPEDAALIQQKQQQALGYLRDNDIDAWLVFVREGSEPILTSLIAGPSYVVQNAAFISPATAAGSPSSNRSTSRTGPAPISTR